MNAEREKTAASKSENEFYIDKNISCLPQTFDQ